VGVNELIAVEEQVERKVEEQVERKVEEQVER
jgi:hypothetical protein